VELNFIDGSAADLQDKNQLIEIILADGTKQSIALITDWKKIKPLTLGTWALEVDKDTGVVHAAPWAESALKAFQPEIGSVGLYPLGHEFPDRDLASIRATRSLFRNRFIA
jgi:hypothetical protein